MQNYGWFALVVIFYFCLFLFNKKYFKMKRSKTENYFCICYHCLFLFSLKQKTDFHFLFCVFIKQYFSCRSFLQHIKIYEFDLFHWYLLKN